MTVFKMEPLEASKPVNMPPRPLSQERRKIVAKTVSYGSAEGI